MSLWHWRRSLGVWETQTKNQGTIESSIAARKTFGHREANCVNLATPTGCHCASREPHRSGEAIKYINTQAVKEAIGLSQTGTKQPQLSGQGISIFFFLLFFPFLFLELDELPACLGKEPTATLSLKEGTREVGRAAERQGVKESMRRKKKQKRRSERKNEDRCCHCD